MQGRYDHLHLRWNPFGEATPEERADLAHVNVDSFCRFLNPNSALELRADHGRGKSTTLLALRKKLAPQAPHIRGSQHCKKTLPVAPWVFLDEVQYFSLRQLWYFARQMKKQNGIVVYSTHQNRRWLFKLAGMQVQKHRINYAQPANLLALFNKRIEWAQNREGNPPKIDAQDIKILSELFGNDIRSMESHLYDCINQLKHPQQPIMPRTKP